MSKRDSEGDNDRIARKRNRRSRWGGGDMDKAFIPGMPTILPGNLDANQEKAYLLQLQIEDISRRLRTGDLGINPNPEERSPSPEPIYNNEGKRLNTREYRIRKKLEDDRHALIQEMMQVNVDYKPPIDYKPPVVRVSDKVMIPQDDHPEINFVGLLIGPRGNTLKSMEKETGAKIIIRGKGSVKEGKVGRKDGQPLPGEDEPLHAYVTAHNPESVKKAVDRIKDILRQGIEVPEGQNDLRRNQLRELALLNGTLRENEGPRCSNCGAVTHKSWQCPDKPNITNSVICTTCGGAGHTAKLCLERRSGNMLPENGAEEADGNKAKIDEEYMSLMAELGEGPAPKLSSGASTNASQVNVLAPNQGPMQAIMAPPGQSAVTQPSAPGVAAPWQTPRQLGPNAVTPVVPGSYVPAPPATAVGVMYPPWQQQFANAQQMQAPQAAAVITSLPASSSMPSTMIGTTAQATMLAQPPPPPPGSTVIATSQPQPASSTPSSQATTWTAQQQAVMAPMMMPPWQQPIANAAMAQAQAQVPPQRMAVPAATAANMQAGIPSWQQYMGLPPPGTAGVQPPIPGTVAPPPPPANPASSVAPGLDINALGGLLTAPPPPPPS